MTHRCVAIVIWYLKMTTTGSSIVPRLITHHLFSTISNVFQTSLTLSIAGKIPLTWRTLFSDSFTSTTFFVSVMHQLMTTPPLLSPLPLQSEGSIYPLHHPGSRNGPDADPSSIVSELRIVVLINRSHSQNVKI